MARDRNQVRQEIEETKASMAAKLDEITERVEGARSKISHMRSQVSVRHQVEERPWTMMGLSVVAGFTFYRLVHARPVERAVSRALDSARESAGHAAESARGVAQTAAEKARERARMGTGAIRERIGEREPSLSRTAFDTVTRAAASSVGAALARALVERVVQGRSRGEFLGERAQESPYQVEVTPPTAPRIPHPVERQY